MNSSENNYSQHENTREDARFILDLVPIVVVTRLVLFCFFPHFFHLFVLLKEERTFPLLFLDKAFLTLLPEVKISAKY